MNYISNVNIRAISSGFIIVIEKSDVTTGDGVKNDDAAPKKQVEGRTKGT